MSRTDWQQDKSWSDAFLPEIKRILGEHLIGEPPVEEDAYRNTDLMVLRMEAVRIGCRVRRTKYLSGFGHEFTIRASRPGNTKTELAKVIEGWGDYFFYGFGDDGHLAAWTLADLRVFRVWFTSECLRAEPNKIPGTEKKNPDGSSGFRVFEWADLPGDFVIATLQPRKEAA